MKRLALLTLAALAVAPTFAPAPLAADEDEVRLSLTLTRWESMGPWIVRARWTSHAAQEVVLDRRLLRARVYSTTSRRRARCQHPDAPRRVSEARVLTMDAGDTYEEWLDLRELCWGRALELLAHEAELEWRYGFSSRPRSRWIVRGEGMRRPLARVDGGAYGWTPPEGSPTRRVEESSAEHGEAGVGETVTASPVSFRVEPTSGRGPSFRVRTLRAPGVEQAPLIYLRSTQIAFEVEGPLGRVLCPATARPVHPIRDFFVRPSRRGSVQAVDPRGRCPEATFLVPGVYEVTPIVELPYGGERWEFETLTGRFRGESGPVRITGGAYVVQDPSALAAAREDTGA